MFRHGHLTPWSFIFIIIDHTEKGNLEKILDDEDDDEDGDYHAETDQDDNDSQNDNDSQPDEGTYTSPTITIA